MALSSEVALFDGSSITASDTIYGESGVAGAVSAETGSGAGQASSGGSSGTTGSRRLYGIFNRSGGSNYTPNIYSSPQRVSSVKTATMYSKTPYDVRNINYLRPSVSSKGSREAYRRNDF